MTEIESICSALSSQPGPGVLATLVRVEGSSYRLPGARMLWRRSSSKVGGISGGCLEEDLVAHCPQVVDSRIPAKITYDTTKDEDFTWGVGLGCSGTVDVLLEVADATHPIIRLPDLWERGESTVLAIVVETESSEAMKLGHCGVWSSEETQRQLVPPALLEGVTEAFAHQRSHSAQIVVQGRTARLFFEFRRAPVTLLVCGASDGAIPLVSHATSLGWRVTITDPRKALLTYDRFPSAAKMLCGPPDVLHEQALPQALDCAVVMSHHYRFDLPYSGFLLTRSLRYMGLLGSRLRANRILAELEISGATINQTTLERFYAPTGLDIGGDGPEAVALSILAEIQAVLASRDARPLRDKKGGIHSP